MKEKKEIKRDILDKFRTISAENGDLLPLHWLESAYVKSLTADEKKLFKKAVQDLVSLGIVENAEGASLNLRLTQKGENLIYTSETQRGERESNQASSMFHFTSTEA